MPNFGPVFGDGVFPDTLCHLISLESSLIQEQSVTSKVHLSVKKEKHNSPLLEWEEKVSIFQKGARIKYLLVLISGVNIFGGKVSVAIVNGSGGSGGRSESPSGVFRGRTPIKKILRSKGHLYWLKIDLNVAEIITVQDYKRTKK